jgi:hypothetical protein
MNKMRETATGWAVHTSSAAPQRDPSSLRRRSLHVAAIALGLGLAMSVNMAHAQDAEEEDQPFEQKVIKQIMTGLGGTNMENTGIDYRERSPLVVPPRLDLPAPDTAASTASVPNWPKDPDLKQRQAAREAAKRGRAEETLEAARPLTPAEMAPKRAHTSSAIDHSSPGDPNKNIVLSPKQLGYEGGLFKTMFGSNKGEKAEFKGEPTRESLTQPPAGYQTPSSEYAYGTGPKEVMKNEANINPMTGKY